MNLILFIIKILILIVFKWVKVTFTEFKFFY